MVNEGSQVVVLGKKFLEIPIIDIYIDGPLLFSYKDDVRDPFSEWDMVDETNL